jgi:transcriptional regulator with XRE-family HTH domain
MGQLIINKIMKTAKLKFKNSTDIVQRIALTGQNRKQFAESINMDQTNLSAYLNNLRHPEPQTAKKIADKLNSTIEELFEFEDEDET